MQQAPMQTTRRECTNETTLGGASYRRRSLRYSSGERRGFDAVDAEGRDVVIELRSDDRARLMEAEALIGLEHDALAPVRDAGVAGDGWFVVIDRWAGPTLEQLLRNDPLAVADVVALLHPVASALDCLHLVGATHRAFCAENVVISEPSAPRLWIVGNPSIPSAGGSADGAATLALKAPEGLDYVPPDLLDGSARPDVYALAVLAFRLMAGDLPFRRYGTLTQTLVERQARSAARVAQAARRPVHRSLEDWARTALAPEERLRPPTAAALVAELALAVGEPLGDHTAASRRLMTRAERAAARPTVMGAQAVRAARECEAAPTLPPNATRAEIAVDADERIDSVPPARIDSIPTRIDSMPPLDDAPLALESVPHVSVSRRSGRAAALIVLWVLLSVVALIALVTASAR